jgi:Zn-dependent peptidase ImmA (M78 family)/transcriptional regulator with XRE-family HTH domain
MSTLGEVIQTARRAHGLTQADLASAVEVSQAALSRYEQDLRVPEPDVLPRIAEALGVTLRFIEHASHPLAAMAVDAHMRRRATARPTIWRHLEARLNMLRMHVEQLGEEVSLRASLAMPTFDPFQVSPAEAARLTRMQWRMPIGPVRALTRWLEAAGCVLIREDFGTPRVDGLSQWARDYPVVLLNSASPTDRVRLTLAHELGHLCLHRSDVPDDLEAQANDFAAEFLMPEVVIKPQLRNLTLGKLSDLKREWSVSMQALIERAYALRTLTSARRTSLYKQLSARGWRTQEPHSDDLQPEQPELTRAVFAGLQARGLSATEIAQLAGFRDAEADFLLGRPSLRAIS